ncbi:MAG: hypothetical protein ICV83_20580 [Cytophagales bacterium]|nr:hypothetical protein [Cytophagales bacterium]
MSTLDQFKEHWQQSGKAPAASREGLLDEASLRKIITSRVRKHTKASFGYFWASLALQIGVYALFSHLVIKHWSQTPILLHSLLGILLYLPFTIVLLKKFKRVARGRLRGSEQSSIHDYLSEQHQLLHGFFTFKKRYEMMLIPLSAAIGVILVYTLYVPGGVQAFPLGAFITYTLTLLSCYWAIRNENRKSFIQPLQHLRAILQEYQA